MEVRRLIDDSVLCLFEITRSRDAKVLLELGYAQGKGKHCVTLSGKHAVEAGGFSERQVVYRSLRELHEMIESSLAEWLGEAIHAGRVVANLDSALLAPLASSLLQGDLDDEYTVASEHGFSEEQVRMTMNVLTGLEMARATQSGWAITALGQDHLPGLIAPMTYKEVEDGFWASGR